MMRKQGLKDAVEVGPGTKQQETAVGFDEVSRAESEEIRRRRAARGVKDDAPAVGLALSGGGIRSAAVCLGTLQAFHVKDVLGRFDYISTVSGGGYIGSCLNVAMSKIGGSMPPFGDDVRDSPLVAHLRNYSNYLMPRNRSAGRNWLEGAVIVLRGLIANAVCVAAFLVPAVILTVLAFPETESLTKSNFLPRLTGGLIAMTSGGVQVPGPGWTGAPWPMIFPTVFGALLVAVLILWAVLRTLPSLDRITNDTRSLLLRVAFALILALLVFLAIDLLPLLIASVLRTAAALRDPAIAPALLPTLAALMAALATFAGRLGRFLESSSRTGRIRTILLRAGTKLVLVAGALLLPALLFLTYVWLYQWALEGPYTVRFGGSLRPDTRFDLLMIAWLVSALITLSLRANNYSLHWFYRDRLSAAFLVGTKGEEVVHLDGARVTDLKDSEGPLPIVNTALNVQGSLEANKRGRNADFFSFTPLFTGSALTGYVTTEAMEELDRRLDLGTAMAVSGAAASANMGSSTVRLLSPTLSLLNVRLGYYLLNPRYVGAAGTSAAWKARIQRGWDRFYLFIEMFNGLTERRHTVYLTDGGHIENLGIYELLRRQCDLIVAIDSEADPELACGSLLRLERYARIDLGARITLPWEEIARRSRATSAAIQAGGAPCEFGPHCAVGRIDYGQDRQGLILYVKSSLSGDEKDYLLDYARRYPAFPHESTSDQFFSEEQFEMYRALGFHMIQGLFGRDRIAFVQDGAGGFADEEAARTAVLRALGKAPAA